MILQKVLNLMNIKYIIDSKQLIETIISNIWIRKQKEFILKNIIIIVII